MNLSLNEVDLSLIKRALSHYLSDIQAKSQYEETKLVELYETICALVIREGKNDE